MSRGHIRREQKKTHSIKSGSDQHREGDYERRKRQDQETL